jgi:hypothetical protein
VGQLPGEADRAKGTHAFLVICDPDDLQGHGDLKDHVVGAPGVGYRARLESVHQPVSPGEHMAGLERVTVRR